MLLTPLVFVLGLILSAARVRPWTAGRAVLTLLGSGLESILTGAASLLGALIRACQVLDGALVRNLAILSVLAFLGRATPFGGWSVLVLAALLPWSGGQVRMRRRWFDAEASPPPLDEAALAASLASVGDAELRQRANPLRETLTDPALAQRQRQDRQQQIAICYRTLDARRAQRRAQPTTRPRTKTP